MKFLHNVIVKIPPVFTSKNIAESPGHQNVTPGKAEKKVHSLVSFAAGLVLAAVSGLLGLCTRTMPGFIRSYPAIAYPFLAGTSERFYSLSPFSLSEIGLYFLCLLYIYYMILHIRQPIAPFSRVLFLCGVLPFLSTVNCDLNYCRAPFFYETGIAAESSPTKELLALCRYLINQINNSLLEIGHSGNLLDSLYPGQMETSPAPSTRELPRLGEDGRIAMIWLGQPYPQLNGYYPHPKPLINSRLLPVQQFCGIYFPFTIETNYNRGMPCYNIPHIVYHELSHLRDFMWEDEASSIGYLTCIGSDSPDFCYSDYLVDWVCTDNTLAKADPESYHDLHAKLSPQAAWDLGWNNQFWERSDGPVAGASAQTNDRYFKTYSQGNDVKSYGQMMDLVLVCYKEQL